MGLKVFGVGSTDQKSNNLLRDPKNNRNSQNVMTNINGEYTKRPGTIDDPMFDEYYDSDFPSNMIFIKSLDEYFYSDGVNYHSIKNGVDKTIPGLIGAETGVITQITGAEYLNTFIFTHQSRQLGTYKYDARSVYRAGLPTPIISGVTAGSFFLLSFFEFIDNQGNTIYGPATITPNVSQTTSVTFNTFRDPGVVGFFQNDILTIPVTSGVPITLNKTSNVLTGVTAITALDGDYVIIRNNTLEFPATFNGVPIITIGVQSSTPGTTPQDFFLRLKILTIVGTTVTFDPESFQDREIVISTSLTGSYNILHNTALRLFTSSSETTGYEGKISQFSVRVNNTQTSNTRAVNLTTVTNSVLLSDFYDITTSKLRPPKCKYINTYGQQLVCSNVLSFWDFDNKETNYTNNDLVMYSDLSTGDLGENFSEGNRQLIGNTYDGEITGAERVKDSMLIFKNRSAFSLDGVLIPGQYSLRKIETNEIGCLSDNSILVTDSEVMFQGQDGLYAIDGYRCIKITEFLDPFFSSVDKSKTRSVMNNEMDQFLFWTDFGIVVFDYAFKKWYIWKSIDSVNGITVDNNQSIRFIGLTSANMFQTPLNDNGVAIDAFIDSTWFDLGEPGLLKKATDIRVYAMNNSGQTIEFTYYMDWSLSKIKGPYTINMSSPSIVTIHRNLDIIQNQSFSFRFRNNVINENLNLSGYEVETGVIQKKDKNVK